MLFLIIIQDITITSQTLLMTLKYLHSERLKRSQLILPKAICQRKKKVMGKFKTVFVACLGLGIAAGAGYYLYKKFLSQDVEEENNSSTQVNLGH